MMKKALLFLFFQSFIWVSGFAENPRWKIVGTTPIPAHADLDVRWEAPTTVIPSSIWVYNLSPNRFSSANISNVVKLCSLSWKNETVKDTSGTAFQSADGSRKLTISFLSSSIRYSTPERRYGPTNLTKDVPDMSKLAEIATNFVNQIGIPLSAVTGYFQTDKFNFSEVGTMFDSHNTVVTNIELRTVTFRRSVDGIPFVGGDGCGIDFGEHGIISRLSMTWHDLKRIRLYDTLSPKVVINLLRQGKVYQGLVSDNVSEINWPTVRSVAIVKALPCYFAGGTDQLYPFLVLFAVVDTGYGNVDTEIECPIIDETKP